MFPMAEKEKENPSNLTVQSSKHNSLEKWNVECVFLPSQNAETIFTSYMFDIQYI